MPPMLESSQHSDVRVADFLDDKFQTPTDLESLDALLQSVREQHGLLKNQVRSFFVGNYTDSPC